MLKAKLLSRPILWSVRTKSSVASSSLGFDSLRSADMSKDDFGTSVKSRLDIPFARAKIGPFFQNSPQLGNQFLEDSTLVNYLKRLLPADVSNFTDYQ